MQGSAYHFISVWKFQGKCEEVSEILQNPLDLPRWWPEVYLSVHELGEGEFSLFTKGYLPYRLRWNFRVTENLFPNGFSLEAWGDLEGQGRWNMEQQGEDVIVTYDWKVQANHPVIKRFSGIFRPIFESNHRWAMAKGEQALQRELTRRR